MAVAPAAPAWTAATAAHSAGESRGHPTQFACRHPPPVPQVLNVRRPTVHMLSSRPPGGRVDIEDQLPVVERRQLVEEVAKRVRVARSPPPSQRPATGSNAPLGSSRSGGRGCEGTDCQSRRRPARRAGSRPGTRRGSGCHAGSLTGSALPRHRLGPRARRVAPRGGDPAASPPR